MATVSESETKILDPHIPNGEKLIEVYCGDEKTIAVTDRRVIDLRHQTGDQSQETEIESTLLTTDYIVGTKYEREEESISPDGAKLLSLLFIIGGVVFVALALLEAAFVFLGIVMLLAGGLFWYSAEEKESGEVSITLRRAANLPDKTWSLPKGKTDVAQMISEQVATLHQPT
jgi:hypothetical protein